MFIKNKYKFRGGKENEGIINKREQDKQEHKERREERGERREERGERREESGERRELESIHLLQHNTFSPD